MTSSRKISLVLPVAAVLCFLVLSAFGDSGGPDTRDGGYPAVTFYVA
jgi:hypothetical protein